jgi:hypothetical protein
MELYYGCIQRLTGTLIKKILKIFRSFGGHFGTRGPDRNCEY